VTPVFRRAGLVVANVALISAIAVLAYMGFAAVFDTTHGRVVDPELDPDAPGYEAFVESTPTLGVLGRDADGALSWVAVLALSGPREQGGSILLIPAATLAPAFEFDLDTLREVDAEQGPDAAVQAAADVIGAAVGEVAEVDPGRLAELVRPVAPLTVANPDAADGFPAGPVVLDADTAAAFLLATEAGESDLTRLARHEAFWQAWLAAVSASSSPDAVPGETGSGIGRFVRGLAAGDVAFDVPPVRAELTLEGTTEYRSDPFAAYDVTENLIPFPAAARPGNRPRVRVLDGVGADGLALRAAREVVGGGGQIVVVGNVDRFEPTAATRVVYFEPVVAEQAVAIADELGVVAERLDGPNPDDGVDVTVVAGADLLAAYGLTTRPTTGDDPG
jgi:hypothetical protein